MKYDYSGVEPGQIASPARWTPGVTNIFGTVEGVLRLKDGELTFTGSDGVVHLRAKSQDIESVTFNSGRYQYYGQIQVHPYEDVGEKLAFSLPSYSRKNRRPEYLSDTWSKAFIQAGFNVPATPWWTYLLIALLFAGALALAGLLLLFFVHASGYN